MSTTQRLEDSWKRDCSGQSWGFVAVNVDDPPQCIRQCRERFLKKVLPKDETFEKVCQLLADSDHMDKEKPFQGLYCCDSQLCGVDNLGGSGKDPNVNWLINACQDIGYHSIVDPGPPQSTYTCTLDSINKDDPRCAMEKTTSTETATATSPTISPTLSNKIEKLTIDHSTFLTSLSSSSSQNSMPTQTTTGMSESSGVASQDSSQTEENTENGEVLSTGVKVAITVCTLLALISLLAFLFCFLRRRSQRHDRLNLRRRIKHPTSPRPPDSPTPLVSPTVSHTDIDGVALTPPARLRERKFLPTVVSQLSPSSEASSGYSSFPTSPLYSPTSNKLIPRHERTPKICNGDHSPPLYPIAPATLRGGVTAVAVANKRNSPSRPPRPQGTAVDITGLASPGPPPTRALPSTPPNGPISPTVSSPSTIRSGDADSGIIKPVRNPTHNPVLLSESRSLYALTEEDTRDSCNSWGSWSGYTGGKVGSTVSSPKRRDAQSRLLQ